MTESSTILAIADGSLDLASSFEGHSFNLMAAFVLSHLSTYLLVAGRLAGFMLAGPLIGQSLIPWKIRLAFVAVGSLTLLPVVPNELVVRPFDLEFVVRLMGELAAGFLLGLGVLVVMFALRQAGQMIDQQSGLALGELFDPSGQLGSPSVRFLFIAGIAMFLVLEPINGYLVVASALLDTFRVIPIGQALDQIQPIAIVKSTVSQSLLLSLQVVAPTLALLSCVTLAVGAINRAAPNMNFYSTAISVRVLSCFLVLAIVVSGIAETIAQRVPEAIDQIVAATIQS